MGLGAAGTAAAIGAAGAVGSAALGNRKGSGGSGSSSSMTSPWWNQQPYDITGLAEAQRVYAQRQAEGPYTGEQVAGGNPVQQNAINNAAAWNTGTGAALPGQTAGLSSELMGAAPGYLANAGNIAAGGIAGPNAGLFDTLRAYGTGQSTTPGASPTLSNALESAAVNGANSLGGFTSGLQGAAGQAASDPTSRITADASQYANNPGVKASLKSVNDQIDKTLNEQTVPQLNREAAMGGALNSSRAGAAEAMANENAAIAKGNADASILNNAYNTGTNTAAGLYSSGLNTSVNANLGGIAGLGNLASGTAGQQIGLNEFNTNSRLGASNAGLSQGLGYELGDVNARLSGNNQLGNALGLGINAGTAAGAQATNNFNLGANAGTLQQQMQQAADTDALQRWELANQYPQTNLNNFWGIISTPLGTASNSSFQQQLPTPNYLQQGIGGALAGAGLYQTFGGGGSGGYGTSNATDPYSPNGLTANTLNNIASSASLYGNYSPQMPGLY